MRIHLINLTQKIKKINKNIILNTFNWRRALEKETVALENAMRKYSKNHEKNNFILKNMFLKTQN